VADAFPPLRVSRTERVTFVGSIRSAGAGALYVSRIASSPHLVERRPELISRSDKGYLKLSLHVSGRSMMIQDGREIVLEAGDITLYDTSKPYTMVQERDFSMLVAMFPREAVRAVAPDAPALAGLKFDAGSGLASIVSGYLHTLDRNLQTLAGPAGDRLSRVGLELIGSLLATELDRSPVEEPRSVMLRRIQGYIEQNLADPDLSPGAIAAAHFISVRHLHSIFHEEGRTVASWIRVRRLERCRQDLSDPLLADRSVASIAARWGFLDPGHFSKLFRRAFGDSPARYREGAVTRV
jgi:AraC-like DNA-binding protein